MFGWFSKKKEAPIGPNEELTNELHNVRTSNLRLSADLQQANTAMAGLRAERDSLQAKVREQNEADLLLVSMRITQRVLAGEKKEALTSDLYAQQQLMAMSGQYQNPYGGPNAYGAGLSALFGGALDPWGRSN
jgi:hypothetical protein